MDEARDQAIAAVREVLADRTAGMFGYEDAGLGLPLADALVEVLIAAGWSPPPREAAVERAALDALVAYSRNALGRNVANVDIRDETWRAVVDAVVAALRGAGE